MLLVEEGEIGKEKSWELLTDEYLLALVGGASLMMHLMYNLKLPESCAIYFHCPLGQAH